ncbi:MAG: hypothetical protein ACM3PY_19945 [Omnitrophica WOR_2 bacterium]
MNDSFVNTPRSQIKQMREDQKKGALRFSMQSLIGDRFLKRFFGSRLHRRRANPASEAITLHANETDKPDETGYITRGNPADTDATLENEQTSEVHQLAVPENGSDQPPTDDYPLTADVCRN